MAKMTKLEGRKVRHHSLRKRIKGTAIARAWWCSGAHATSTSRSVDDLERRTLVATSDVVAKKDAAAAPPPRVRRATGPRRSGVKLAKLCLAKGISKVVFDRAGYKYHGRVSAVAAGAREGGLQF
jgi:large subunit ribosomal protein L18